MEASDLIDNAISQINRVVIGKEQQVKLALCCLLAKGHLLIEDLPGMGKTTLSHALAQVMGLSYRRVQFTSDLLPADILGVSIFQSTNNEFAFHPGPIFSQLVLADEINRASPKTQSALLEAMEEQQVTVDGNTHLLPEPFFVIATQNPLHQSGTFPLPESQLDRFLLKIELGYPDEAAELQMLKQENNVSLSDLTVCFDHEALLAMQKQVDQVSVTDNLLNYLLELVRTSRDLPEIEFGLSPRGAKAILQAAKAWALMNGRNYVIADDVQVVFPSVAEHRLTNNMLGQSNITQQLLSQVEPV